MEALLPAFIAIVFAETGSRMQRQSASLSAAYGSSGMIFAALFLTSLVSLMIAAVASIWIADQLNYNARTMLLGLAFVFAALGVAWPKKSKPHVATGHPFWASVRTFAVAQFGDNSQFLVFAFAARSQSPWIAAWSGVAAVLVAALVPVLMPVEWQRWVKMGFVRYGVAMLLFTLGCFAVLSALRAVG
jgi:Ca2+/H+ antiporter, TMEM165/GDT1 family